MTQNPRTRLQSTGGAQQTFVLYASLLCNTIPIPISSGSMCSVTAAREQSCWGLLRNTAPRTSMPGIQLPHHQLVTYSYEYVSTVARKKLGTLGLSSEQYGTAILQATSISHHDGPAYHLTSNPHLRRKQRGRKNQERRKKPCLAR